VRTLWRKCGQDLTPLDGHGFRHGKRDGITAAAANERQGDAGVAAGGFHEFLARPRTPRASASQTIDAPMPALYEYAGLRPSILQDGGLGAAVTR